MIILETSIYCQTRNIHDFCILLLCYHLCNSICLLYKLYASMLNLHYWNNVCVQVYCKTVYDDL